MTGDNAASPTCPSTPAPVSLPTSGTRRRGSCSGGPSVLAPFTQHDVLKVHSCGCFFWGFPSFLRLISRCMYTPHFLDLLSYWLALGCFRILRIPDNTAMNAGVQIPSHCCSGGWYPEKRQVLARMRRNQSLAHCRWECKIEQPLGKPVWGSSKS